MKVFNLKIGQTLPLTAFMKNLAGQNCAQPAPLDWSSSNTTAVELDTSSTMTGAKAIAPGSSLISLAADGYLAEAIQINVARPDDGGVALGIAAGMPH